MLVVNGWAILAHPLFLDQLENLTLAVDLLKAASAKDAKARFTAAEKTAE
jgi:toxin YhaV